MSITRIWILTIALTKVFCLNAQLENPIFNGTFNSLNLNHKTLKLPFMSLNSSDKNWGVQVLHYFKNNEYMENHNPGATLFGTQIGMGLKHNFNKHGSHAYLGALGNIPFGGIDQSKIYPLIQLNHAFNSRHHLTLGSLHGNTRHQLYEPVYNYELNLTRPIEYGIQYLYTNTFFESDLWLDWRQMAITQSSQQEIISFGWSGKFQLNAQASKHKWSIPMSNLIYHQGGESLTIGKPVQNKWNGSAGLRYEYQNKLQFESVVFGSQDFSPRLLTSFKDGHAWYNQIKLNPQGKHQLALSHYYAEEFFAPLGTNLFLSEQIGNPYKFTNYRNFLMARYQWMGVLIPNTCIFDFRFEPIWHIEKKQFAFSAGFYVKYRIGAEIY